LSEIACGLAHCQLFFREIEIHCSFCRMFVLKAD
jgi:hypothetical protein